MDGPPNTSECKEIVMNGKQSKTFRDYCADKAETAKDEPTRKRFKRMEVAWLALADQQDWLDGEQSPLGSTARLTKRYGVNRVTRTGHDVHEGKHRFQIKPARSGRRCGLCQPPRRCYARPIHSMISDQSNANIVTSGHLARRCGRSAIRLKV